MNGAALLNCEDPGPGRRLGPEARAAIAAALRRWRRESPGAVLLRVHGDAWHHAGEPRDTDLDRDRVVGEYQALVKGLFALPGPVVVLLDGQVSGFGLALAMAADVRLATPRCVLAVGDPVSALLGGTGWLLARAVGAATSAQLAWTGATVTADEAIRRGLLAPAGKPGADHALADRLAADRAGSSALKRALVSRQQAEFGAALDYQAWLAGVAAGDSA